MGERKGCVCAQLCPTLCDPMNCSPPGPSVHGILQARILEWVAISSSRGSSQPRNWTYVSWVSSIGRQALYELRHCGSPSSPVVTDRSAHGGQLWGDWGSCSQCLWMWKWSGASLELTSLQGLLNESRLWVKSLFLSLDGEQMKMKMYVGTSLIYQWCEWLIIY